MDVANTKNIKEKLERSLAISHELNPTLSKFIKAQPMFFVATAATKGRVNLSPKGMDTLRIVDDNHVRWLNLTGSGNETAAHVSATGRMTLMFCGFGAKAMILRTYGIAKVLHPRHPEWTNCIADFPDLAGSRQIFDLHIDLVQTSCGTGVPEMKWVSDRGESELEPYYRKMSERDLKAYWAKKNAQSIDGHSTGIFDDN